MGKLVIHHLVDQWAVASLNGFPLYEVDNNGQLNRYLLWLLIDPLLYMNKFWDKIKEFGNNNSIQFFKKLRTSIIVMNDSCFHKYMLLRGHLVNDILNDIILHIIDVCGLD